MGKQATELLKGTLEGIVLAILSGAVPDVLRGDHEGHILVSMLEDLADLFEQSAANAASVRAVVGEDPSSSPRRSSQTTRRASGSTRSGNG